MTKIRFFIIVLVCWAFAGCKTSQKFAQQTKQEAKVESATEHTTETSVVKDFKSIKDINEEFEIEGTVWSAPDSTGTQHPQVTFKGKKNNKTKIQEQSGSTLLQVQNIKSAVKGESVAEQATHLETIRWSFGDTVRLIITLSAMIFLIIIYLRVFN